uniref:Lipocalin/cytosolic fatty-acid binding domain-containing protein n=1 Tax=Pongo abelii TaxID=9601 RepID=A0A8I5TTZ9_PONAB
MKKLGVGISLRNMGAMAKPDCIITCDGKNLTIKTESTLKTTQFSCTLGEKFEETTADGRKTQTVCSFTDGVLPEAIDGALSKASASLGSSNNH